MEFIKYTIGLECWIETRGAARNEKLVSVKVEFEQDGNEVQGQLISARTLGPIEGYSHAKMTADAWSDRPQDPYDDSVEAVWALGLFGITPAAID